MSSLYPPIEPYATHMLPVSDIHTLYVEESGNPKGIPVLRIHGGPGSKSKKHHRQIFDPEKYRIILYDQRGCWKSAPFGALKENTIHYLAEDIEKIRVFLWIDKWLIVWWSRGSTLWLYYVSLYPDSLLWLLVYAIYLCREKELAWSFEWWPKNFFPEQWEALQSHIPHGKTVRETLFEKVLDADEIDYDLVFAAWNREWALLKYLETPFADIDFRRGNNVFDDQWLQTFKLYLYYVKNHMFLEEGYLLKDENTQVLQNIPWSILQWRYDLICPPISAYDLSKKRTNASFEIVENVWHRGKILDIAVSKWIDKLCNTIWLYI